MLLYQFPTILHRRNCLEIILKISRFLKLFLFQLTAEEYNEILRSITSIFYVRCRGLHNKGLFWTCLILSQIFLFFIILLLWCVDPTSTKNAWEFSIIPFTAVVVIVIRLLMIKKVTKTTIFLQYNNTVYCRPNNCLYFNVYLKHTLLQQNNGAHNFWPKGHKYYFPRHRGQQAIKLKLNQSFFY